ncbi:MAG: hypothetical protein ACRDPS_03055 [Nocardioides sp.]|uniref:hypothetical protein n=1 Tax=Nocardioides sp. TaxID=35761 RepID=UPI003D6BA36D
MRPLNRSLTCCALSRASKQVGFATATLFDSVDVVLTPTLCMRTPELGVLDTTKPEVRYSLAPGMAGSTSLANVTGGSAMSVPSDFDPNGLLLSLAGQLERTAPWPRHAPLAG